MKRKKRRDEELIDPYIEWSSEYDCYFLTFGPSGFTCTVELEGEEDDHFRAYLQKPHGENPPTPMQTSLHLTEPCFIFNSPFKEKLLHHFMVQYRLRRRTLGIGPSRAKKLSSRSPESSTSLSSSRPVGSGKHPVRKKGKSRK